MMRVRIVRRPVGLAPEWVRNAWIGLTLPTQFPRPRIWRSISIERASASRLQRIGDVLRGRTQRLSGYAVPATAAVGILAETQPEAAEWWRANAAEMLSRRSFLLFDADSCVFLGEATGGSIWLSQRYKRMAPASPGRIALLWIAATVVCIADSICFGAQSQRSVVGSLYLSGTPILAALLAAWILRLRGTTLHLLSALVTLDLAIRLTGFLCKLALSPAYDDHVEGILSIVQAAAIGSVIAGGFQHLRSLRRRVAAYMVAILVSIGASHLSDLDYDFWRLSNQVRPLIGRADPDSPEDHKPEIETDRLWDAQPGLIAQQLAALHPRETGTTNVYAMAIAGSGTQALFGREAQAAVHAVAAHFGADDRGSVVLSNAEADEMHTPLATRTNIAAVAHGIGAKADHAHDLLFVYLASHGSRTAELTSALPDYQSVQPISSTSTAQALRGANIDRRIIVVSACYAATWIPALANANTIVIAAAAKDRTSFGCDDSRDLTVFGEAFLAGLASPTISLHDAFEDAKRKIATQEAKDQATPSLPQAYVGHNMEGLWLGNDCPTKPR